MYCDGKKIFVAGATGMTGSAIIRDILKHHPTTTIVASQHITQPLVQDARVHYVKGDLRSLEDCQQMVRGCEGAVMAASFAGGSVFTKTHPWEHMHENLIMNEKLLEAFRLENVKRIVFIGSAAVYQAFEGRIKENELDLNQDPHLAYFGTAWTLRFIEKLCAFLHKRFDREIIIVRAANIFGPYDKFNSGFSTFIPAIIRKAVDKMDPFELWGSPEVTRDVIYVEDFARAIVMMMNQADLKFETFNLGSGVKTTVGQVAEWALKYANHKPSEVKYIQDKPTTIKFRALDCTKAKDLLGWAPQCTIEVGIEKTTQWWQANQQEWQK